MQAAAEAAVAASRAQLEALEASTAKLRRDAAGEGG